MNALECARIWADAWKRAWPAKDVAAVAALYADDAVFRSLPFRDPHMGVAGVAEYVRSSFADEEALTCWFGEPAASGERAAVEYWATFRSDGKDWTLAGISVLHFAADGRVDRQRDYWSMEEGDREPPVGWGA